MIPSELQKPENLLTQDENLACIHTVFEQMVMKTPSNIAVAFRNKYLSYLELNEKVNKLAAYLSCNYGIKPDEPVGIMLERSEYMIIGILAILKAGGAYVPIDPEGSPEHTNFIISDAGLKIVLCASQREKPEIASNVDFIDISESYRYIGDGQNIANDNTGANLAFIIYTSGSTGKPKGVLIRHDSLINFVNCFIAQFEISPEDIFLQNSVFFFDGSIMELFVPLASGASLVFLEPSMHKYPEKMIGAIEKNRISTLFLTPAFLQSLLDYIIATDYQVEGLKTLKNVIVGGEVLSPKLANLFNYLLFKRTGVRLTNIYGPTEATVWVTTWDCATYDELTLVPIGKPINNAHIYILDQENNVLKPGETGELVIGGVPVGKGYLNRPELDAEKFTANPFMHSEKMYRTGDKARFLPDGNIEFLGRMDNLVKLNGLRIELGEIENAVLKNEDIKECVVLMKEINGANELVVYFTLVNDDANEAMVIENLATGLNLSLPNYMAPGFYLKLNSFSITGNGKIDRRSLPVPTHRYYKMQQPYVAPSTETEEKLVDIFKSILSLDKISVNELILNLGIKSLTVTKILIEIRIKLKSKISIQEFFQLPTIKAIAAFIENTTVTGKNAFILVRQGEDTPLFLLPSAFGTPLEYSPFLAYYPVNQPIYSIVFRPEQNNAESPVRGFQQFDTLYGYAGYLVTQMKLIQPEGPYNMVGYSFGGMLAFEMSVQLQKTGEKIGLVALVGALPPLNKQSLLARYKSLKELNLIFGLNSYLLKKYFKFRLPFLLTNRLTIGISQEEYVEPKNLFEAERSELLEKHLPMFDKFYDTASKSGKFRGGLLLFTENLDKSNFKNFHYFDYYGISISPKLWKKKVTGEIRTFWINCNHDELLFEPHAKEIAIAIKDCFTRETIGAN